MGASIIKEKIIDIVEATSSFCYTIFLPSSPPPNEGILLWFHNISLVIFTLAQSHCTVKGLIHGCIDVALSWMLFSISSFHAAELVNWSRLGLRDDPNIFVSGPFLFIYKCLSTLIAVLAAVGWWFALGIHGMWIACFLLLYQKAIP